MKDPYLAEQDNGHTTAFSFADFSVQLLERRFDVLPLDIRAGRVSEDEFECALMLPLHELMVPKTGTRVMRRWFRDGWQKAVVALANKNARILWAIMTKGEAFDARHVSVKPGTPAASAAPA